MEPAPACQVRYPVAERPRAGHQTERPLAGGSDGILRLIPGTEHRAEPAASIDLNRSRHASRQDYVRWDIVQMDADRYALGQPHPGEDRIYGSNAPIVGLRVRNVDPAGDAVDVATEDLAVAHQFDLSGIANADGSKVRLLEISIDPEGIGV